MLSGTELPQRTHLPSRLPMNRDVLRYVACPNCAGQVRLVDAPAADERIETGCLECEPCRRRYPIVRGIPRFIESDDYASTFSFEWTRFATTQLDSVRGWTESEDRFRQSIDFPLDELKGKVVLDAGCGMGRFAEIAAKYGATVIGVDLSYAVEPASKNLARFPNAHIIQGDLRRLPFREGTFDLIYSLGVLHHTPDPRGVFERLIRYLKPEGKISITLYAAYNRIYVASSDLWRKLTTRLPPKLIYYCSHLAIPAYYLYKIPILGNVGKALWPISLHPDPQWRLLDTLDCYTPKYQNHYTHPTVFRWFREAGLRDITVLEPGISFIATRPGTGAQA